MINVLMRGN